MSESAVPSIPPVRAHRKITGMSAVLLPFQSDEAVDWTGFEAHVERTLAAGLVPAVNMDTGYINLLTDDLRKEVLHRTSQICIGRQFVAGAFVADQPADTFDRDRYAFAISEIAEFGGDPVIFQSYGLTQQTDDDIIDSYHQIAATCDRFYGFELGKMFLPFGSIYSETVYTELMKIPQCAGAKHSSLRRDLEWRRLELRDALRPDFLVLTGNDLAIDMVMYGSDYLLGLSSFCPQAFAVRDRMWEQGDPDFLHLNDILQFLGFFAFRNPVPAYKHNCAMFLKLQDFITTSKTHPKAVVRPDSDIEVLQQILDQLSPWISTV